MTTAFIGMGSNLADPMTQVRRAVDEIAALPGVEVQSLSGFYQTAPMGPPGQPDYINAVISINTTLTPLVLLHRLQAVEQTHGRERKERWGARTLDLDILLYGDEQISTPELTVPHPGIADRAFVLYPLNDCNPELNIPGKGKLADLLQKCPPTGVTRMPDHKPHVSTV
jgi:2-amino-4-hydroxy-6-hydroxymethyldihydropteridine diphosphokinase